MNQVIFDILHVIFGFLPVWFEVVFLVIMTVMVSIAIFKLVAFVMDVLPFV